MKNKNLLKKIACFGKKHHFPMGLIVFEFAVVIICSHIVEAIKRKKWYIASTCLCILMLGLFMSWKNGSEAENRFLYAEGTDNVSTEQISLPAEKETVSSRILNEDEINVVLDSLTSRVEEEIKSDTYYIKVNRKQNCVTIYAPDETGAYTVPVKSMICSTGGEKTPTGVYTLGERYEFRKLLFDVYGQYATRIVGQILFHSSPYNESSKDCLIAEEFNNLGNGVSHGCIRLTVRDSKWIFDNCEAGTVVEIYDDDNPGPLGKPDMIKVPADTSWDPTDESEGNPWNMCKPKITGVGDRTVKTGTPVSYMYGVSATDTCGNNITEDIKIYGKVNENVRGKYMVVYYVKDLIGRYDIRTAIYTVE